MRKIVYISLLLIWPLLNKAQNSCLPDYGLPVKMINISGKQVAYVEKGKGKNIILIHGLGGNISHWTNNIKPLAKTFRCIALDLPGYGHSDKNKDTANIDLLGFYADVVLEFIRKKSLKDITLAGHSMGGQIAVIAALKDQSKVKHMVLVSPAGLETFTMQEAQLLTSTTPSSVFEKQDEAAIRASFKRNFYNQVPEKLVQERLKFKDCRDFSKYAIAVSKGVQGMFQHPVKDQLKNIKQDVLIIYGNEDAHIPNKYLHPSLSLSEVVKNGTDNIPVSKSILINNAGHLVQYEQPDELNKAIRNFVTNPYFK